jgi:hypothetical protein
VKIIFRLMLLGGIIIIVIAFYMRIYCHDHTSLSTQNPNKYSKNDSFHIKGQKAQELFKINYTICAESIIKTKRIHTLYNKL